MFFLSEGRKESQEEPQENPKKKLKNNPKKNHEKDFFYHCNTRGPEKKFIRKFNLKDHI